MKKTKTKKTAAKNAKPKKYKPVPITAAREIAKRFDKDQVIVVAWDGVHKKEHVTTYGVNKEQCRQAALGGDRVKAALGWPDSSRSVDKVALISGMYDRLQSFFDRLGLPVDPEWFPDIVAAVTGIPTPTPFKLQSTSESAAEIQVHAESTAKIEEIVDRAVEEIVDVIADVKCDGEYVDFQGATRDCLPGGEGCGLADCESERAAIGGPLG